MNGNNMTYESSQESSLVKRYSSNLNINDQSLVSSTAALGGLKNLQSIRKFNPQNRNNLLFNARMRDLCQTYQAKRAS